MTNAPDLLYIGGQWMPGAAGTFEVINPSTEEVAAKVAEADATDIDRALEATLAGFDEWRRVDAWTRSAGLRRVADLIRERADAIAAVMTEEQGKPLPEAVAEVRAAADQFDWFADEARRIYGRTIDGHSNRQRLYTVRQPIGPVAAFTAWNFPALLPARKMAAALAAGCSIIVKPPREAPRTALCLVQACHDARAFPDGAVQALTGDSAAISEALIGSPEIRKISLTGSVPVGRELLHRCADKILPATLELGGHAPVLVFADTDINAAAEACARTKFRNCGQVCISPTRFYVQQPVRKAFTEAVVEVVRGLRLGDGADPATDVGPLTNQRRLTAIEKLVDDAVDNGATVAAGGRRPPTAERGYFYEPTVLTDVTDEMAVMQDEPFGPILPVAGFDDLSDGLAKSNATPFGLAGYVFTDRTTTVVEAAEGLEVGMVGVNSMVIATAEAPFGGIKESGYGREGGTEGIEPYLITKYVNVAL